MDNKIKLFAVASVVAVMASGCSGYRGTNQGVAGSGANATGGGTTQMARTGQVAGSNGLFGQRRATTCAPCAANAKPKSTYTYTPAPKPAPTAQAGQHNQQYYIDKWNREQATQKNNAQTGTYSGYGSGNYNPNPNPNPDAGNTTYYDYSSAGQAANNTGSVSASNKSIYTGSYQQKTYKPYQPTTYSGGSSATTNTNTTYVGNSGGGNGSTYTVKKGDTVFEIMRQTGVYWKDIIKMNNLQAPAYNINPGQIIRLK